MFLFPPLPWPFLVITEELSLFLFSLDGVENKHPSGASILPRDAVNKASIVGWQCPSFCGGIPRDLVVGIPECLVDDVRAGEVIIQKGGRGRESG